MMEFDYGNGFINVFIFWVDGMIVDLRKFYLFFFVFIFEYIYKFSEEVKNDWYLFLERKFYF